MRERTAKTTTRLADVPSELWALLSARVPQILERAGVVSSASTTADEVEGEAAVTSAPVKVDVPRRNAGRRGVDVVKDSGEEADAAMSSSSAAAGDKDKAVLVSGDKDLVKRVVSEIEAELAELVSHYALLRFFPALVLTRFLPFPSRLDFSFPLSFHDSAAAAAKFTNPRPGKHIRASFA